MAGPYRKGLGVRKRNITEVDISDDENNENFFLQSTATPKRRFVQAHAEIIPEFRPEDQNSNVKGWLHKIDQLGDIYDWDHKDRQFIMQVRLRGSAREWYDDLEDYDMNWEEWKQALETAFPRSFEYVDCLENMLARNKMENETMTKYFHDKISLLKKCKIYGEAAISCIIRGLPVEIRANAKAYKCETPQQLYCGYLSSLENYKAVETQVTKRTTWRREGTNTTATKLPSKICYGCRRPGHEIRDCWTRRRCEICQRMGHTSSNCWHASSSSAQETKVASPHSENTERRGTRLLQDGRVLATSGHSSPNMKHTA
ncbi:uncharacterized protein LOC113396617 [Vanessa tameamea]|uniref:Uncharacterized protein LOC113396617 n=1 Tax=Vanessa tameamea TaxID=334116 RepID=A0ABM4AJS3_VANTA